MWRDNRDQMKSIKCVCIGFESQNEKLDYDMFS